MLSVLWAFLVTAVLGSLLGLGLSAASKALAIRKDERIQQLEEALPGINCGACGYAGCAAYAEAIATQEASLTLCSPGGASVAKTVAQIMGVEVETSDARVVAQVHCRGGVDVSTYSFRYTGLSDCNALFALFGGDKVCKQGCLGLGSCIRVCPVNAISYDSQGKIWIDRDACIACGKCIEVCPTGVIKYIPYDADYIVACNNTDKGAAVRKYCKVGCIGCKLCEKRAPGGGYKVEDFLATIDYRYPGDRAPAEKACPAKCIIPVVRSDAPAKVAAGTDGTTGLAGDTE